MQLGQRLSSSKTDNMSCVGKSNYLRECFLLLPLLLFAHYALLVPCDSSKQTVPVALNVILLCIARVSSTHPACRLCCTYMPVDRERVI